MARYTSVNVEPPAAADLRTYAALLGGQLGKRATMTDALRVAVAVATAHLADPATLAAAARVGVIEPPTSTEGN